MCVAGFTPGHGDEVIFAEGTFIDSSMSEFSADGPVKALYTVPQSATICFPQSTSQYMCVAGVTPGYGDEVIFADGTFIDGSTSELSADGPIRPPYTVYCQGGTHWTHWAFALEEALQAVQNVGNS